MVGGFNKTLTLDHNQVFERLTEISASMIPYINEIRIKSQQVIQ